MKSDAELIREIKRDRKELKVEKKASLSPRTGGSLVPNNYPTMIYIKNDEIRTRPSMHNLNLLNNTPPSRMDLNLLGSAQPSMLDVSSN